MLERHMWYSGAGALAAGETSYDRRIEIRPTADFVMRGLGMYSTAADIAGRLRRADGAFFVGNEFVHLGALVHLNGVARPTPIYPQLMYPRNSIFSYDLRDLGGAGSADVLTLLHGVERYPEGAVTVAPMPERYEEAPDAIAVTQSVAAGQQVLSIPVRPNHGDPFFIRTLDWASDGPAPTLMRFRLWDHADQLFSNTWVPLRLAFAGPGAPFSATPFPEMMIPKNGGFKLDLWNPEVAPFTVRLTFGGVRLK